MTDIKKPKKRRKYRKGLKADYRDATPEQVAKALHSYRSPRYASRQPALAEVVDQADLRQAPTLTPDSASAPR
ncbi:MAG: hypothetical protein F4Y40_06810 [Acidimicrobiia bacterium]|nr:hypothetical protein [Acidimicrobiia bacterium]MYC84576.1 hypothetical protein [Acidimicrobiia bacterium]